MKIIRKFAILHAADDGVRPGALSGSAPGAVDAADQRAPSECGESHSVASANSLVPTRVAYKVGIPAAIIIPFSVATHSYAGDQMFGVDYALSDDSYKLTLPGSAFEADSDNKTRLGVISETRSEMLFKLSFDSNLDPDTELSGKPEESGWSGGLSMERVDFIPVDEIRMQDISGGFSYSASLDIEQRTDSADESQIVSSRQLGVHYGRLGTVNYSGVDLGFRQFNDGDPADYSNSNDKDLWSLGVTTGRRFAFSGLEEDDPLWTVSLRGQFSLTEDSDDKMRVDNQLWYVSPGLHWQHESFELSADLLMPFMSSETEEDPDYSIRAKIQKRF